MPIVLRRLHIGRWVRAAGSNLRAAHVSGIDLRWVYLSIFVTVGRADRARRHPAERLSGVGRCDAGAQLQPERHRGGRGRGNQPLRRRGHALGTALAAWLFAVVNNGLILLGVNSYWQYLATGIILVLALVLGLVGVGGRLWPRPAASGRAGSDERRKGRPERCPPAGLPAPWSLSAS